MGQSGDPRKQQRPEEGTSQEDLAERMTEAFPPTLTCLATGLGAKVVPFPGFVGGKAIALNIASGPMQVHVHVHPDVAEEICEEIMAAKANAESKVQAADLMTMKAEAARTNGHGVPA